MMNINHVLYLECIKTPLHKLHDMYIYGGTSFIDIEDDILKNICNSFAKPINIKHIRNHCNFITELNINLSSFLRKLLEYISHRYESIDYLQLIQIICEYDLLLKKSYKIFGFYFCFFINCQLFFLFKFSNI